MLYTVAIAEWTAGRPIAPGVNRSGLFRTRAEAREAAAGRSTLAVALRYDPARGVVSAEGAAARAGLGRWSAPAIEDDRKVVTVLAPIPAELVREVGPARVRFHAGSGLLARGPHRRGGAPEPSGRPRASLARSTHLLALKALRFLRGSVARAAPGGYG